MYVYICIYIYIYMHIYMYKYILYSYVCVCVRACVRVCMCVHATFDCLVYCGNGIQIQSYEVAFVVEVAIKTFSSSSLLVCEL